MTRIAVAMLGLICLAGCASRQHVVNIAKIGDCDGFDWNGRVRVTTTWKGFFAGTSVDRIELEARDGRSLWIDTKNDQVKAYVEMQVDTSEETPLDAMKREARKQHREGAGSD